MEEGTNLKKIYIYKMGGAADMPEGHAAIQRNLVKLEKWADKKLMKLNIGKGKTLLLGRNNPTHQCRGPHSWKAA